ncbi:MAG: thiamine pyrophosphate-dependent dehydrogenase E1 component subunit alpha, partial [Desulfocucumaceae bacterium]
WQLPVIYVCENNLYAISVSQKRSQNIKDVAIRATSYGIPGEVVDGNDILAVSEAVKKAINHAREGNGPILIECKTYRWGGHHVGDPGTAYRSPEEVTFWKEKCPIKRFKTLLISEKIITRDEMDKIEADVKKSVDESIDFARNSPYPEPKEALEDIFTGRGSEAEFSKAEGVI